MKFFSGFALENESALFENFLERSDYCVAGFSAGAQKALEYVLNHKERVDTLQLFSPAFFQCSNEKFKRLQLMGYKKDPSGYMQNFIKLCHAPYNKSCHVEFGGGSYTELEALLSYEFKPQALEKIAARNITLEVYLGGKDHIIDAIAAKAFFLPYATTYFINSANHFLKECDGDD